MNKKINNIIAIVGATMLAFTSCDSLSDYDVNPNAPTLGQVPPSLILTNIITTTFGSYNPLYGTYYGWSQNIASISAQQGGEGFQGFMGGEASFDWYSVLRNANSMEQEGDRVNIKSYAGVGNFFRAYCITEMCMQMGDIPMSDAMKAQTGNYAPFYDSQKDVFITCFNLLEDANTILAKGVANNESFGNGDLVFGGNPAQWQKLVNSYRLRLLINLSKKVSDQDLKLKEQFNSIVSNREKYPLFTSNSDNARFRWYDIEGNRYPRFYVQATAAYYRIGNTYYNLIKKYNDPRIAVVAERTAKAIANNPNPAVFDVNDYGGVNANDTYAAIEASKDNASMFNRARYCTATGEPMIMAGYSEMCFNIAEAIKLAWISGDAAQYYNAGIRASMEFYGIDAATIDTYLANPQVVYNGTLTQILEQKYISFFNNSGWEAFYNWRRTGIPTLHIGANMSNPSGKIPVRWRYPRDEYQNNSINVGKAIQSQFGGSDGVDDVMWILK